MLISVPNENVLVSNLSQGDVVTFSYEKFYHKNPTIFRVKSEVSWKEVLNSSPDTNYEGTNNYKRRIDKREKERTF